MAGMSCTVLVYGVAKGRGPIPARTSVYHAPHIEIKKRPSGAFSPFLRRGAPKLQSVREADTLAAEWQLPREWERRVGPETSRGRHHPKRFSLGLHPVSLGKTKEMGWNRQHNLKSSRTNRRVPPSQNPPPGGDGTPPLRGGRRSVVGLAVDEGKGRRGRRPLRVPAGRAVCHGISRVRVATWEMVKTPPVAAF